MARHIKHIFVVRIHHNMAFAIATQNIQITTYNFDGAPIVLTPENITSGLKPLPKLIYSRTIFDSIRDAFTLTKSIKKARPDIVHINALQDLIPAFIAVQISAFSGHRPTIIAMSRNSLTWGNSKKAWLYARIINLFSDGFIALSTTHKDQLLRLGVPSDKLTVIPNPYEPACLRANQSSDQKRAAGTIRILYIANICANKAQDVLIRAAAEVLKNHPNVEFELVGKVLQGGEEYLEKVHSLIHEFGIEESIHFAGEVPYDKVLTLLQKSDIFVFPTLAEMMPRAVIEAMVMGKPVIASAVDGILDLIENRKTGLLVRSGNNGELAEAICELVENPALASQIGLAGQNYVLEFCSPERVGKQFCDFYEYARSK